MSANQRRPSFAKLQRERARMEKAEAKRQRRQQRKQSPAAGDDGEPEGVVPEGSDAEPSGSPDGV
jgi:hypothetical protein